MTRKLVVIGLDGATFDLLEPMMEAGDLPTISRLIEDGASARLESVRPPISCPAWFCYGTGKEPGKLGIYGWRNFDPQTCTDRFNDYKALEEPEIWDHLGKAGYTSAVINIPTHFPPKAIDGYMVSGMQAEEHQAYTHPAELKDEIKQRFGYQVAPDHKMLWDYDLGYEEALELFPKRLEVARYLLPKVDVLHVTIFHIDEIQHNAWGTPELEDAWRRIDDLLDGFLDELPDGTDVLLMSDHGFASRPLKLRLNTWLEEEGYLTTTANPTGEALRRVGISRERLERALKATKTLDLVKRLVPDSMQQVVKEADGATSNQRRLGEVDWDETVAFASTNFTIHVLDAGKIDEIIEQLRALESPAGDPFFEEVLRADDVLHGHRLEQAPDILLLPADGHGCEDPIGKPLWEHRGPGTAGHAMDGILVAHGPSFKQGITLDGARLVDLAPTILHRFGLPVPEDMDGQVLDILVEDRQIEFTKEATVAGAFSEQELEKVEERLRGLGYLE